MMRTEARPAGFGDYLEALAFRVLHGDGVLSPRRASMFEGDAGAGGEEQEAAQFEVAEMLRPRASLSQSLEPLQRKVLGTKVEAEPVVPAEGEAGRPRLRREGEEETSTSSRVRRRMIAQGLEPIVPEVRSAARAVAAAVNEKVFAAKAGVTTPMQNVTASSTLEAPRKEPARGSIGGSAAMGRAPSRDGASSPKVQAGQASSKVPAQATFYLPSPGRREGPSPPPQATLSRRLAAQPRQSLMVARAVPEIRNAMPILNAAPRAARDEMAVEITIGRLEIRAAAGPAPAQIKATPRRSEISLKEYLDRRPGGQG